MWVDGVGDETAYFVFLALAAAEPAGAAPLRMVCLRAVAGVSVPRM